MSSILYDYILEVLVVQIQVLDFSLLNRYAGLRLHLLMLKWRNSEQCQRHWEFSNFTPKWSGLPRAKGKVETR
jgi:hypothetical protein